MSCCIRSAVWPQRVADSIWDRYDGLRALKDWSLLSPSPCVRIKSGPPVSAGACLLSDALHEIAANHQHSHDTASFIEEAGYGFVGLFLCS